MTPPLRSKSPAFSPRCRRWNATSRPQTFWLFSRRLDGAALVEPSQQVITHAQCVGHDRDRGVHGGARRKEAAIDDVQVSALVRATVAIEHRTAWIAAKA